MSAEKSDALVASPQPSIHVQVSEWLAQRGREHWVLAGGTELLALCEQWRDVSLRYGDDSDPACGCLLGLVRKAWGPGCRVEVTVYEDGSAAVDVLDTEKGWRCSHVENTLGLALAAALLAAPPPKAGEP